MQCPVCTDVALAISSREGVEIDYCPQCRGVWLDRGELDKILDRVAVTAPAGVAPRGDERRHDEPRHEVRRDDRRDDDDRRYDEGRKKKRRGGFLEDLFDLG